MTTNKPEADQLVGDGKYDTMLFCDTKTDEEKSTFFLSGRGYETGVIAHSIQNDVATAYQRCSEYRKEAEALQAECEKLRKDAERYRWLRSQSSPATVMLFGVDEGLALDGMDEAIDAAIAQDVEIFEVIAQQEADHDIQ